MMHLHKKAFAIIFLSIFLMGALTPSLSTVKAQINPIAIGQAIAIYKAFSNSDCDWGGNILTRGAKEMAAGIVTFFTLVPKKLAEFLTALCSWITGQLMYWPITKADSTHASAAFSAMWKSTRDMANMLIVLGFVIVGIATALRIQEYGAKKFLLNLIISALLINFSGLFCGIIIDASTLAMKGLSGTSQSMSRDMNSFAGSSDSSGSSGSSGAGAVSTSLYGKIKSIEKNVLCQSAKEGSLGAYTAASAEFLVLYAFLAIAFFFLAILMLARFGILGILYAISPLAFVFWAFPFPKAKDLWNKWWQNFIKWAFVGVSMSFFLSLAGKTMEHFPDLTSLNDVGATSAIFTHMAVVLGVLGVGIYMSLKSSGVASAVIGGAMALMTGGAAIAGRLAARTALGQKLGAGKAGEALKDFGARTKETLGLAPIGHAAKEKQKREGEARSQVEALSKSTNAGDQRRFEQLVRSGRGSMGAAAIAVANNKGDLSKIISNDPKNEGKDEKEVLSQVNSRISYAEAFGHDRRDFVKKNYKLAEFDSKKVAEVISKRNLQDIPEQRDSKGNITQRFTSAEDQAKKIVVQEQLAVSLPSMSTGDIGKINPEHVGPGNFEFVRENVTPRMIKQMAAQPSTELINNISTHLADIENAMNEAKSENNMGEYNRMKQLHRTITESTPGLAQKAATTAAAKAGPVVPGPTTQYNPPRSSKKYNI